MIEIKAFTPQLAQDYFAFFDHWAFADGSSCYCNGYQLSAAAIQSMHGDGMQDLLRESALQMVRDGKIQGYLTFDHGQPVAWCNANDRMNYVRVGEFDLDHVPADPAPFLCLLKGQVKAIVCFAVSPEYRGKGMATLLLERVCKDAKEEGYAYVEAYPCTKNRGAYTGPYRLYEKAGFQEYGHVGHAIVMRKYL